MFPWNENKLLKKALRLYAGPHVLDRVLKHGEQAFSTNDETKEMTLLFVDIKGFTTIKRPYTAHAPNHGDVSHFSLIIFFGVFDVSYPLSPSPVQLATSPPFIPPLSNCNF